MSPDDSTPDEEPLDGVPAPEDHDRDDAPDPDGPPPASLAAGDTGWTALAAPGKPDGEVDTRPGGAT